jgi:periplasmic protein TonB
MKKELTFNMMANTAKVDFLPSAVSAYMPSELPLNASRQGASQLRSANFFKSGLAVSVLLHLVLLFLFVSLKSEHKPVEIKEMPITVSLLSKIPIASILETPHEEEVKPEVRQLKPKIKPVKTQKTEQILATPLPVVSNFPAPNIAIEQALANEQAVKSTATSAEQITSTEAKAAQVTEKLAPKGDVTEPPKFGVAYLNNPKPQYPSLSRRSGEEGRILLKVLVNAKGEPESVVISSSSGFERLDAAALAALRKWRFVPAKRNNETISAYVTVPISFKLD